MRRLWSVRCGLPSGQHHHGASLVATGSEEPNMDLVIKNGTIVTATESYSADIGVDGGMIALIGRDLSGDEVIDARGMYVLRYAIIR